MKHITSFALITLLISFQQTSCMFWSERELRLHEKQFTLREVQNIPVTTEKLCISKEIKKDKKRPTKEENSSPNLSRRTNKKTSKRSSYSCDH